MEHLVYFLYRAASGAVARLPLRLVYRLGAAVGWLGYWLLPPYRRLAVANLRIAFGNEHSPAVLRKMARTHFARIGANLLSSVKVATMPREEILKFVEVENAEVLRSEVAQRRGVIFAMPHMGNWEILAQFFPQVFPHKAGAIYQRLGNRRIDAAIRAARARQGLRLFERGRGLGKAIALVREGGGVGVLVDQHAGDKGIWCPFFGRLASTTPMAATMALRAGALLVPGAVMTDAPGRWRLVVGTPLEMRAGEDVGLLVAQLNQAMEKLIRRSPEDWLWVHNRWKTPQPHFLLGGYKRGVALPPGFPPERLQPFRILVRSSNWLGDAVMTTPAVQAIRRGRPDARVSVLARGKLAEYWERVAGVDEVIRIEPRDSVWRVAAKIRGRFDVAVVLPNSIRTGLEVWLAGIPRRVGRVAGGRGWLLNQPAPVPRKKGKANAKGKPRPASHQVYHYLEIARSIGALVEEEPQAGPESFFRTPALAPLPPQPSLEAAGGTPWRIGLCPGAEYGSAKRWFPERFAEVVREVSRQRPDCQWLLFGAAGDTAVGAEIAAKLKGSGACVTNLIGQTTLGELIERLATCRLLLSNDTGTMHLAAALGVPTVALFGSTEPRLTGPLGPGHRVVRHQVECSPCFLRECPLDFRCMKAIEVGEVVAAILER